MALIGLIFLAAVLFSAVGLGGASGYLAAMAALDVQPELMRPVSLALNVMVSAVTAIQFGRVGAVDRKLLAPLALPAVPAAFVGGRLTAPEAVFRPLVCVVLLIAAWRLLKDIQPRPRQELALGKAAIVGAGVGMLSGLTGIGGGVFMTPALLVLGWAEPRTAVGTTAAFIVVNSLAGLLGHLSRSATLPSEVWHWAPAALAGGVLGSWFGSRWLEGPALRRILAVVLLATALKFLIG